jgi:hypothetical protein
MFDILSIIPGKKKLSGSGWHTFNGICCHHRGHRPDKRMRSGIKFDGNNWSLHCFNCGYKCSFILGKSISLKTKKLLSWCGIDDQQISKWNLESLQKKDLIDFTTQKVKKVKINFKDHVIPEHAEMVNPDNLKHKKYVDYLRSRCINHNEYPFLVTPNDSLRMGNRIIIPYTYKNKIVGHTSRFIDGKIPKYINEQQSGYVFGFDFQKPEWSVCLVVEGIFDAISLNACAIMHNTISDEQALLLSQLNRPIIVVPDQDKTGLEICDRALELGYQVSLPNWAPEIKDVNDAVVKYGKLATLLSILQSATSSKVKIELRRKAIVKRL